MDAVLLIIGMSCAFVSGWAIGVLDERSKAVRRNRRP